MAKSKELEKKNASEVAARDKEQERFIRPRTSVYEYEDSVKIFMDIPGVAEDKLDISYQNGELEIIGKKDKWDKKEINPVYCERFEGTYRRVFSVDETLDVQSIDAKVSMGVLELTVPKIEAVKPRKIEIKTS
jgi:HSP20 family molecular chaperone IbpA